MPSAAGAGAAAPTCISFKVRAHVLRDALRPTAAVRVDGKLKAVGRLFDRVPDMRLKHASVFELGSACRLPPAASRLMAVGDPRRSLAGWRDARPAMPRRETGICFPRPQT